MDHFNSKSCFSDVILQRFVLSLVLIVSGSSKAFADYIATKEYDWIYVTANNEIAFGWLRDLDQQAYFEQARIRFGNSTHLAPSRNERFRRSFKFHIFAESDYWTLASVSVLKGHLLGESNVCRYLVSVYSAEFPRIFGHESLTYYRMISSTSLTPCEVYDIDELTKTRVPKSLPASHFERIYQDALEGHPLGTLEYVDYSPVDETGATRLFAHISTENGDFRFNYRVTEGGIELVTSGRLY